MSNLPRKTIDDLKARYFLEPILRDVYVEGVFDKDILSSWYRKNESDDTVVYNIDIVDISEDILKKHSLTDGNKQRVIALAKELGGMGSKSYSCLVDRDLEHWFGQLEEIPRLLWTEYCSLELYYFSEQIIKEILIDVTKAKISTKEWQGFYSSFVNVLKVFYSMRLADFECKLCQSWMDVDKFLVKKSNVISFDYALYIERNLHKNGFIKHKQEFIDLVNIWFVKLDGDPRLYIRGHDFVKLLTWSVKGFKGISDYHSEKVIERLFLYYPQNIDGLLIALK
ncbi:DUF4435 domain-containing protein [Yersinia kristensenii]|uniref:DUF4435 domain-containing protein n=1 Tax=Yersinia kristensenii TaxID=28152 RepID=UPI0005DD58FB|nr:DUF4435 domain-containing protein [Yersinia kristensenii]CNG63102.1 Uncharacterised protein [Yersinia kristensenii]CNK69133.1 Uncharacterised protein [Yersinia kristensenii]